MAAGSDTERGGRDGQVSLGVTQWLLTCHLSWMSFHQNWSMEASEWPVELSAGILCNVLNSVALRQLPSPPPAPSVPPPEWHQGMSEQKDLGGR